MRHPGWPGRLGMHRMVNGLLVYIYIQLYIYIYIDIHVYIYILCSMYNRFTYIWVIFRANVGQYSIHGAY